MSMVDDSSNSDSSNSGSFGFLIFTKRDGCCVPYSLVPGPITIGSGDDADIRIKKPDERLQSTHCLIEIDENGIATLLNKAGGDTVRVNDKAVKKLKILEHDDMIDVIGKKFQYSNENLLHNEVQTVKVVPASLSSRNRETINIFAPKSSPTKSPTFKNKSPSQKRRSVRRSPHKVSDLIILDTPERSSEGKKWSLHVTPKQVVYAPIVEDVSPATPPHCKEIDDVFKTPVNTPGLFENLRKSVLQSRTRKSGKKILPSDERDHEVISNKRNRESSMGSQRSVKRRRMMYSTDNSSEVEVLEESFESFNSKEWSEISQDQTNRKNRMSDLTSTSFTYNPFTKCMSEPRVRQTKSVRLSRHNKTISVNFDDGPERSVNRSVLLANGIREYQLVESPKPSTSNFVMTPLSDSPLNYATKDKSLMMRSPASPKLKRLQETPKSYLANINGSPKLESYISNNLSKFVGLKQLMRNREDLSDIFGTKALTSTPKISSSENDLTDVEDVKTLISTPQPRNSPKNILSDISRDSPKLRKSQASNIVQDFQVEKSMFDSHRSTRTPKYSINSGRTSISATKTPPLAIRKLSSTPKMMKTFNNEVLDLSAVNTPHNEISQTRPSKRSTKIPIAKMPNDVVIHNKSLSDSAVNESLDTTTPKRSSRTPKRLDPSEYELINSSTKSEIGGSDNFIVSETGRQKTFSQYDSSVNVGSRKSISSPRLNKSLQNKVIDHDYAKRFGSPLSAFNVLDSTEGKQLENNETRSARISSPEKSLSMSRKLNSSDRVDLENNASFASSVDDKTQYVASKRSLSTSQDLDSSEIDISITSRLRKSTRTSSMNKYAEDDDEVLYVSGSEKSRSPSQKYNSPIVIDLETSRRSIRTPSTYESADDDSFKIHVLETSGSTESLARRSGTEYSDDEAVEIDVMENSRSRKLLNTPDDNQYIHEDNEKLMSSSGKSACMTDILETSGSTKTPNGVRYADERLMHTSGRRTRTPGGTENPRNVLIDTDDPRTSMSTSRRQTKTPGSTRKSTNNSLRIFNECNAPETNSVRRSTRKASTYEGPEDIVNDCGSNKSISVSQVIDSPVSKNLDLEFSTRIASSKTKRLSQTPRASNAFSSSKLLNSSDLTPSKNEYPDEKNMSDSRSMPASKSFDSPALETLDSGISKRRSATSVINEHLDNDLMNVNNSRSPIFASVNQIETPSSLKKSILASRINSPAMTSEVDEDVTLEIGDSYQSEPRISTRMAGSVELDDVMNVTSRSRRQTRTASGSLYLEDEVMNISMSKKSTSQIISTPNGNKCIMSGTPKNIGTLSAPKISKSPKNDLTNVIGEKLVKTPKKVKSPKNDLTLVDGIKKLLATPNIPKSPKNDLSDIRGVKKLLQTPKTIKSPKNDLSDVRGVKKLLRTPKVPKSPENDLSNISGVKKLLRTPKAPKSPENDLSNIRGVKKLLRTPKVPKSPENDLSDVRGVRKLLQTPKAAKSPKNDLTKVAGLKKLMASPKSQNSPKNDLTNIAGVKKLMSTPKQPKSPKNDLRNIVPLKRLMSTPKPVKEPSNNLSDVSGIKDLFSDDQEDLFASVFNKKPMRTYSAKLSMSKKNESIIEDDAVDSVKSALVEEWVKQQASCVMDIKNPDEIIDIRKSTKSIENDKTQTKKTRSKTNDFSEVENMPDVTLEKKNKRQKININENDYSVSSEKEPKKRTRGRKKSETEKSLENETYAKNKNKTEENNDNESVKSASRSRGKTKNADEKNVNVLEENPTKTRRKKNVENDINDKINIVETKLTRNLKSRSKKFEEIEEFDTQISTENEKPIRRGRSKKDQSVEMSKDPEEGQSKTATSNKEVQGRGRNKKAVVAVQGDVEEVKELQIPLRRGRSHKASEANEENSKDVKESPALTRRGRKKKATVAENDDKVKDSPALARKGRNKKATESDKDEEVKEAPAPVRRGRSKKTSEANEDDLEEMKDAPAPMKRGRIKKTSEANEDKLTEVKQLPAPTRRGRDKKTAEAQGESVKEPLTRGRNKKMVEDVTEVEDVKKSPAPKRGRRKAVDDVTEEEPKRTRRVRGDYDKYGGAFLSESPLNTKRIRGKK